MFEDVKQWVEKNVTEDAKLDEFVAMLPEPAELAKHPEIKPLFDSAVTSAVNNHDRRFKEEKLPEILKQEREAIVKELNPEETPEQRKIRELTEKVDQGEKREKANERRSALRQQHKVLELASLGLEPEHIEPFSVLGDEAIPTVEALAGVLKKQFNDAVNTEVQKVLKERGIGVMPKVVRDSIKTPLSLDEAQKLARENPEAYKAIRSQAASEYAERLKAGR